MSKDYHNEGQEDASEDKYDPPHGAVEEIASLLIPIPGWWETVHEENTSYDKGVDHTTEQKDGGCFLTTACVEHAGLADDCHELQVLRRFRGDYVAALPGGEAILAQYYRSAPVIVRGIQASQRRDAILKALFGRVKVAVALIEAGHYGRAFDCYAMTFKQLKSQYGMCRHVGSTIPVATRRGWEPNRIVRTLSMKKSVVSKLVGFFGMVVGTVSLSGCGVDATRQEGEVFALQKQWLEETEPL